MRVKYEKDISCQTRKSDSEIRLEFVGRLGEDFIERFRKGEHPQLAEYTEKYPDYADEIDELFPALIMMENLAPEHVDNLGGHERKETADSGSASLEHLGDFHILREVGRGGMGIVYEAEQESLGRRVALKVLPKQMLLDPNQKKRFSREAKAAAKLHHTNIVPVFGVGEHEGLQYYAMQFIHGLGLDEVLTELKQMRQASGGRQPTGSTPHNNREKERQREGAKKMVRDDLSAALVAQSLLTGRFDRSVISDDFDSSCDRDGEFGRDGETERKRDKAEPILGDTIEFDHRNQVSGARSQASGFGLQTTGDRDQNSEIRGQKILSDPSLNSQPSTLNSTTTDRLSGTFTLPGSVVLPGQSDSDAKSTTKKTTYWQSVARIGIQVAEGLQFAHDQGILHRDIKPSNLLLDTRGTVWITDFGLAKQTAPSSSSKGEGRGGADENLTATGDVVGTLRYMPPEAFEGKADARSDVYSLGLTLYELLALQPAFHESDRHRLIKQVTSESPERLRKLDPHIPRDLVTVIHKAIDREPSHRYQSAEELAEDLQRYVDDEPIKARRISPVARFSRWCKRNPAVASLSFVIVGLLIIAALASFGAAMRFQRDAEKNRQLADGRSEALADEEFARQELMQELFQSGLADARANRWGGRPGQRINALKAIRRSAALMQSLQLEDDDRLALRNEAIAALTSVDLKEMSAWKVLKNTEASADISPDLTMFAADDRNGSSPGVSVYKFNDPTTELLRVPFESPQQGSDCRFSPGGRYFAAFTRLRRHAMTGGPGQNSNNWGILIDAGSKNEIGGTGIGEGNLISGHWDAGIWLTGGATNNLMQGNVIGTNADATGAIINPIPGSNFARGIWIDSANNTVGTGNIISGNAVGVLISGADATGNVVRGSFIGTGVSGTTAIGNVDGVRIESGATGNLIGGTDPGSRNVISGNGHGVFNTGRGIFINAASGNTIQGNYIGTTADGMSGLGNSGMGIQLLLANDNVIGGGAAGAGNVISANHHGVFINGDSTGNRVQGNLIGTDKTGTGGLGNDFIGVLLHPEASANFVGTDGDGVDDAGEGNIIADNKDYGISIRGGDSNVVAGNWIGVAADNTALGNVTGGILFAAEAAFNRIGTNGDGVSDDFERNVISGNLNSGIYSPGNFGINSGNIIAGNYIGTDVTGKTAMGNAGYGLFITGENFRIGTDASPDAFNTSERNVIADNGQSGVYLDNTTGTVVAGNYIGVAADGVTELGNALDGVQLWRSFNDTIGGTTNAERNIISANGSDGIQIQFGSANVIQGNYIGTTADGLSPLGNGLDGIKILDSSSNTIGGSESGAGNVIGANIVNIEIRGTASTDNVVMSNLVGVAATGETTFDLPVRERSILLVDAERTVLGDEGNGNTIAGHFTNVIEIFRGGSTEIVGNHIGTNTAGDAGIGNSGGIRIVDSPNSAVTGNLISGVWGGLRVEGADSTGLVVRGNKIGTNLAGTDVIPNTFFGISITDASGAVIGGNHKSDRNLISGNGSGIHLSNGSDHVVMGNYIGTNVSGSELLGSRMSVGIEVTGSSNVQIGGTIPGSGNVISGNSWGIHVRVGSDDVRIQGNKIGTDVTGFKALPNSTGIFVIDSTGVLIGGTAIGAGNVISGNMRDGVNIDGAFVLDGRGSHNVLQRNRIGVGLDGQTALGNGRDGIRIWRAAQNNTIGTDGDGINDELEGNVIAHNAGNGVTVIDAGSVGNSIRGNSIHSNSGLGIDLGNDGVTPNDDGDATAEPPIPPDTDTGPNDLQNFPVLRSVNVGRTPPRVAGQLRSTPESTFIIDFYANAEIKQVGKSFVSEGERWVGSIVVTTNELGVAGFTTEIAEVVVGEYVTATATNSTGSTSEFSGPLLVRGKGEVFQRSNNTSLSSAESSLFFAGGTSGEGTSKSSTSVSDSENIQQPMTAATQTYRSLLLNNTVEEREEQDADSSDSSDSSEAVALDDSIDPLFTDFEGLLSEELLIG